MNLSKDILEIIAKKSRPRRWLWIYKDSYGKDYFSSDQDYLLIEAETRLSAVEKLLADQDKWTSLGLDYLILEAVDYHGSGQKSSAQIFEEQLVLAIQSGTCFRLIDLGTITCIP